MSGFQRFEDTYVEGKRKKFKKMTSSIREHCSGETEKQSTNRKEDKCRDKRLSELFDFHGSSTGNQSSTKTCIPSSTLTNPCNRSSTSTSNRTSIFSRVLNASSSSVVRCKDKICANPQRGKDTGSPFTLTCERSVNSSCKSPSFRTSISSFSSEYIFDNSNKSSCSFQKELIGNTSPIKIRDRSHSPIPSLVQHQDDNFDYLPSQLEKKMPICVDEMSFASFQTTPDGLNKNDVITQENTSLQVDPDLREFVILDELVSDQEEGEMVKSHSGESTDSQLQEETPTDEIDEMLDERNPLKGSKNKKGSVKVIQKVVLEEIGHNHFDLLPEGWIRIMHASGMPVYLNKKSRVCTMSKPYYLGPGSSRKHNIPLSAIPCLHYQQASELEKKNKEEKEKKNQPHDEQLLQSDIEFMSSKVQMFEENDVTQSLEPSELHEYCKKAFKFKTLTLLPFRSYKRKNNMKKKKSLERKLRQNLQNGTKLLKFPKKNPDGTISKEEWLINPNGKSYTCILHEYAQIALKKVPKYEFKELENPKTPFSATVFIENMMYGSGMGVSKKEAKNEAAKAALEVLIPGIKNETEPDGQCGVEPLSTKECNDIDMSFFDQMKVEDPRVAEFCAKSTEPLPYAILLTCLCPNTGKGNEIELSYTMNPKSHQNNEYTIKIGTYKASVPCKSKEEGKQRAAQAILKSIHPNLTHWGSLLRIYGNSSINAIKEKKKAEREIKDLQKEAKFNEPNFAVLNKLKTELLKLKAKREALKTTGQFVFPDNIVTPSLSSTELNKVNL